MSDKPAVYVEDGIAHYRASALGLCTTALIALRSGFEPMAAPDSMQRRWDEGHLHETNMVQRLNTEYGIEVFNREREVWLDITPTVRIIGHIDGEGVGLLDEDRELDSLVWPVDGPHRLVENKTMSSQAFKDWHAMDWEGRWKKYPGYAMQSTVYGAATGLEQQLYCTKDKESGQMRVEVLDLPAYPMALIKAKVLGIESHVRQGLPLPEECVSKSWPCPVFYLGPCGEDHRDDLGEREDEVVTALAITYDREREVEKNAKQAKETARDEIKRHLDEHGKYQTSTGWKVTWTKPKVVDVEVFDEERFRDEQPDLYEQYLTTKSKTTSSGGLRVTAPKEK